MAKLIDADDFERKVMENDDICEDCAYELVNMLCDAPKVDAVPAVEGKWIPVDNDSDTCSVCNNDVNRSLMCCYGSPSTRFEQHPYCPWCGAKMRGEFIYDLVTGDRKDGEQDA